MEDKLAAVQFEANADQRCTCVLLLANFLPGLWLRIMLTGLVITCNLSFGQIKVSSDGKVGIGTLTPSTDLEIDASQIIMKNESSSTNLRIQYLYGKTVMVEPTLNNNGYLGYNNHWMHVKTRNVFYYNEHSYSDSRIKEEVKDLKNSLSKVLQMNAVKYKLAPAYRSKEDFPGKKGKQSDNIGFIAQDLMDIVPEAVTYDSTAKLYAVSYTRIVPLLVEAIKEMNTEYESMQTEFEELKLRVEEMIAKELADFRDETSYDIDQLPRFGEAFLKQNQPNPFKEKTTITFHIGSTVRQANLRIYDMQGRQIKSLGISDRDKGEIVISANELSPGIYYYSLIADSKRIDTRQMILTD